MTILWLLFLLQAAYAGKITPQENRELKKRCNSKWTVQANMFKRLLVSQSKYPFAVALSRIKETSTYDSGMIGNKITWTPPACSGVLISSRHILTAAHCLFLNKEFTCKQSLPSLRRLTAQEVRVFLGSSEGAKWWNNEMVEVASVHVHQDYDLNEACRNSTPYDIAAIELKQDVRNSPVCMPERDAETPQNLVSIGYGSYGGYDSLQAVVYNEISIEKKNKAIVAFTENKNEHAISGDSGGPMIQYLHGKHYLFGIASSWQKVPRLWREAVSTTFVDVREHLGWICEKTGVCSHPEGTEDQEQPPPQGPDDYYYTHFRQE